jgi:8-oxo-dGTP pyrophosphatase MutT (NUDIX family)
MHRRELLETLALYSNTWARNHFSYHPAGSEALQAEEDTIVRTFLNFIETEPQCFSRETVAGHLTGSALITSPALDQVLLTLHAKLGIWVQLGGHADGDHLMHRVALREAQEESGLSSFSFLDYHKALTTAGGRALAPLPFDFDFHQIPPRRLEPTHIHYDVRYLLVADPALPFVISEESKDLRWLSLPEARRLTQERSMHRQFDKLEWLRRALSR